MAMASGGGNGPMSDINITPLVDVMLVLLIIFMITAPMMDDKGVELDLPKAEARQMEVDESKLVMTIDKDRQVFLGETLVPHDNLEDVLVNNARLQREGELYLKADRTIPYGFVVQVMAVVKKAGIPKLGMVTDPAGGEWPPKPETPEEEAGTPEQ